MPLYTKPRHQCKRLLVFEFFGMFLICIVDRLQKGVFRLLAAVGGSLGVAALLALVVIQTNAQQKTSHGNLFLDHGNTVKTYWVQSNQPLGQKQALVWRLAVTLLPGNCFLFRTCLMRSFKSSVRLYNGKVKVVTTSPVCNLESLFYQGAVSMCTAMKIETSYRTMSRPVMNAPSSTLAKFGSQRNSQLQVLHLV